MPYRVCHEVSRIAVIVGSPALGRKPAGVCHLLCELPPRNPSISDSERTRYAPFSLKNTRFARERALLHAWRDIELLEMQLETTFAHEKSVEDAWRDRAVHRKLPKNVQASVDRLRAELRPEQGPVDWTGVRKRKALARERLIAMERYATVAGCRREALLGWFGEKGVRCSGCDRCYGSSRPPVSSWRRRSSWR